MATKFIEPGGDATFDTGLFTAYTGTPAIKTDFVHGNHIKSFGYGANANSDSHYVPAVVGNSGRISIYFYISALPAASARLYQIKKTADGTGIIRVVITSTGVLRLFENSAQIGSDGSTISTGVWYRLSLAWNLTSTTINTIKLFKDGTQDISVVNATLTDINPTDFYIGNTGGDASVSFRVSDIYVDDSNAMTDTGNIYVTAKRPNANGTTNGFTTQIGAGGSGYGTGHSPQVNERPQSDTNGWSVVTVASAVTEEYNIESASTGDINIAGSTIIDYMGWVRTKALNAETAQIIVNGNNSNISVTTSIAYYTKIAGSSTYPAGTGADIGEISAAIATTISLYECGIIFAYIPSTAGNIFMTTNTGFFGS